MFTVSTAKKIISIIILKNTSINQEKKTRFLGRVFY